MQDFLHAEASLKQAQREKYEIDCSIKHLSASLQQKEEIRQALQTAATSTSSAKDLEERLVSLRLICLAICFN